MAGVKTFTVHLTPEMHKWLKSQAAKSDSTMREIIVEALLHVKEQTEGKND